MPSDSTRSDDRRATREAELLRHAADVVIEVAADGRLAYVSDAVERILAQPARSFVGRSFPEVLVPEDRDRILATFQKIISTGAEPTFRFRTLREDGLRIEFEASTRTFERDGERRIAIVARDVTEQSVESEIARQRDDAYRVLVESGLRAAAIMAPDGSVVFANRTFRRSFGSDGSLADMLSRMPLEMRLTVETAWYESNRAGGSGRGTCDFCIDDDDGSRTWYASTWEPFRSEDDQRLYAVVCDDITSRKRVELALRSIAEGAVADGAASLQRNLERIALALELDRLHLAERLPDDREAVSLLGGWASGQPLPPARFALDDLPDKAVARGETVVFPTGAARLVPAIAEQLGVVYEGYVGLPLCRTDGTVIGLLSGYSRGPITDADLARTLLATFASQTVARLDRERADAEIRASRDRFEALARQAHEILTEIDDRGRVLYASDACREILGYTPEEMVGLSIPALVHPEDRAANRSSQAGLFGPPGRSFVVNRIRRADGGFCWLESRSSAFTASDGSRRALILSRDVSDQRHEALGRELLYRVVQESTDLVFVCEPDTTLLFANAAAARRLAGTGASEDASGTSDPGALAPIAVEGGHVRLGELLAADDARRLDEAILPAITPSRSWTGELALRAPEGGDPIPTEARLFLFRGVFDGGPTYLGVSLRDVADRRSAEEALRESELRLNQAQKMEAVGRLAGGIAHDFNNLLTAIIGYSDLVLAELGPGHVAHRDAQEILRAADRAGSLTRQLLAFSRRQVQQTVPVDLNAVVADIDRMMRRLIGENIELVTSQDGLLSPILADPGQIEQVIVNLVVNARDAMPHGGRLEIETANFTCDFTARTESGQLPPGDYVVLRISDTGTGMDDETRTHIFEPFFTTKDAHQGTGLGLASVEGIVTQCGGQIDVQSVPGGGTTFTIYLPAAEVEQENTVEDEGSLVAPGHETVLLVEDASSVRRLVERTLTRAGYEVLAAESATAALRLCGRHEGPIDLVLCDVVLPRLSGPELVERLLELRPGLPVLFMSGFTDDTLSRHGLEAQACALIEKPFTPSTVLTRIREVLERREEPAPEPADGTAAPTDGADSTTRPTAAAEAEEAEEEAPGRPSSASSTWNKNRSGTDS